MKPLPASKNSFEELRSALKLKHYESQKVFEEKHGKARDFLQKKGSELGGVRRKSAKLLGAGALAGALFALPQKDQKLLPPAHEIVERNKLASAGQIPALSPRIQLVSALNEFLPDTVRPLVRDEEKRLEVIFEEFLGVKAKGTLEGEHLNTTFGKIGAEQHLRRYPGDVNANHAPGPNDYGGDNPAEILKEGMAPGLGAWGYFASTKDSLTEDLVETERWYAVAQTLYLPDWEERLPYLREWYKYRKVLIVNVENGNAVVAAIADSGPAAFTGKHFGGSPEVMDYLGGPRYKKGPVVLFFVDDPDNRVPLGPVEYNEIASSDTIALVP